MSIDTTLNGDHAGIASAAASLSTLGQGFTATASSVGAAGALSESLWTGSAADAFRGDLLPVRRAIDEVAGATQRANQAMRTFAGELRAVKEKVEQAKSIASAAGLKVGGDSIEPPKPPPVPRGLTLTTIDRVTAEAALLATAQAKYREQLRAYKQAEQLMKEARAQEQEARADLGVALTAVRTLLDDLNEQKFWLAGGLGAEALSRAVKAADDWAHLSEKYRWLAKWTEGQPEWVATRAELAQRIERLEELRGRGLTPPGEANGARWLDTLLGDSKIRGLLGKSGWIGFGAQVITDIVTKKGAEKAKSVGIDAASFGGGALAGDAFLGAITAGGVATAPETLGASLVATAAGIAIYEGLHHPEAIKDAAGWAWDHPWAVAGVPVIGPPVAIGSGIVHGAGTVIHHAGDALDAINPF